MRPAAPAPFRLGAWAIVAAVLLGLSLSGLGVWLAAPYVFGKIAGAASSNSLWLVERYLCLPNMRLNASPKPCELVDIAHGYAVLAVPKGDTEFLLAPLDKIDGIEDRRLLRNASANYWQAAWNARRFVEARLGRPIMHDRIGMAVNSSYARTQDQLHIHIDCVKADVSAALKAQGDRIGRSWSDLGVPLQGRSYRVMRLDGPALDAADPFLLAIRDAQQTRVAPDRLTVAVLGMRFEDGRPGFAVLSGLADPAAGFNRHNGATEELLDHYCAGV